MRKNLFITAMLTMFFLNFNCVRAEVIDPSSINIEIDVSSVRDVEQYGTMSPFTYVSYFNDDPIEYPIVRYGFDDVCPLEITREDATVINASKATHISYTLKDTAIVRDIKCTMTMTIEYEGREVDMLADVEMSVYPARTVLPQPKLSITEYEYTGNEVFPVVEGYIENGMQRTDMYANAIDARKYRIFIALDHNYLYKFENTNATLLIYEFTINKKVETLNGNEYDGYVGKTLSTVSLPKGWTFDNPDTLIEEGTNTYPASYNPIDTKNYEVVNGEEVSVVGTILPTYTVDITTDSGIKHGYGTSLIIEEKDSKDLTFDAIDGYRIKSVLVDGVEVLIDPVTTYTVSLTNVTKGSSIEVISEVIYFKPTEGDNQIVDKTNIKEASFSFDLDFTSFLYDYVKIDDVKITGGFRFLEGSIVLVLEEELLSTLEVGTHSVEVGFSSGKFLIANLTIIESNPETGTDIPNPEGNVPTTDGTINPNTSDNILMYIVLTLLSLGTIVSLNNKKVLKK